jgi:DNA polymerase I-like protein with 3'-5' exonuclease and polymerase domains
MSLKQLKQKLAEQKQGTPRKRQPKAFIGQTASKTGTKLSEGAAAIADAPPLNVRSTAEPTLPMGYHAIGKNDKERLLALKDRIIEAGITAFDYETDGDPEDDTQDPQDHTLVGVSFACRIGQAFYLPMAHKSFGANWDTDWLVANFLKPILEHPNVLILAHNIAAEHQWSLLYGIDMYPKAKKRMIVDTMLMVKALALPANLSPVGDIEVGLKAATKALLTDKDGYVHGLLHMDSIKSFKETVTKLVPNGTYKSGANKGAVKYDKVVQTFDALPVDQHTIDYGCSDSDWTLGLYYKLMPLLEAEGLVDVFFELNVPFMMVIGEYELTGWRVEPSKLDDMERLALRALDGYEENGQYVEGLNNKMQRALIELTDGIAETDDDGNVIVPAGTYGMGVWKQYPVSLDIKTAKPFSWGSIQHKQWLFFYVLKLDTRGLERSKKTGLPSTGADNYEKLVDGYAGDSEFMRLLKQKSKYDKILSTYVNGMRPYVREDTQKLHTHLKLVNTWRLSSSKPNLQNIPRADNDPMGIRSLFTAPTYDLTKDYSKQNILTRPPEIMVRENLSGRTMYIACDYSQVELKVLAWFAHEASMIQTLSTGGDLHSVVAHEVFKLDCAVEEVKSRYKPYRYRAKKVNFGIVYGMTEFGLSKDPAMGMTKDQAKAFINNYYATYPGIRTYAQEQIAFAREHGYVQTLFGNRRAIPEINHPNAFMRSKGENKAMNTPIQGSAGDIIRRAMVAIKDRARFEAPYIRQVMQIHDELIIEAPVEYAAEAAAWVKLVMEDPIEGFSDIMPLLAEPAVGVVWQDALDVEWDNGKPYVKPKKEKKEATDVTIDEIQYALPYYEAAGIEVRT